MCVFRMNDYIINIIYLTENSGRCSSPCLDAGHRCILPSKWMCPTTLLPCIYIFITLTGRQSVALLFGWCKTRQMLSWTVALCRIVGLFPNWLPKRLQKIRTWPIMCLICLRAFLVVCLKDTVPNFQVYLTNWMLLSCSSSLWSRGWDVMDFNPSNFSQTIRRNS